MIVELFGSPGAGKTYAINKLHPGSIKEYKSTKDKILEPIKKVIKSVIVLFPYAFRVRRIMNECLSDISIDSPQYKPVKVSNFIWNISMLATVYKMSKSDIYMDEGIVHRVISMCINYNIEKEICGQIIRKLAFAIENVQVYFLDVSKAICWESIKARNRHLHSIDELSDDRLDMFLDSYSEYCHYVFDMFGFKRMTRDSEVMNK